MKVTVGVFNLFSHYNFVGEIAATQDEDNALEAGFFTGMALKPPSRFGPTGPGKCRPSGSPSWMPGGRSARRMPSEEDSSHRLTPPQLRGLDLRLESPALDERPGEQGEEACPSRR